MSKTYISIIVLLIAFAGGFFLGRGRVLVKTEYINGERTVKPVKIPYPATVYIPSVYFPPTKKTKIRNI